MSRFIVVVVIIILCRDSNEWGVLILVGIMGNTYQAKITTNDSF